MMGFLTIVVASFVGSGLAIVVGTLINMNAKHRMRKREQAFLAELEERITLEARIMQSGKDAWSKTHGEKTGDSNS